MCGRIETFSCPSSLSGHKELDTAYMTFQVKTRWLLYVHGNILKMISIYRNTEPDGVFMLDQLADAAVCFCNKPYTRNAEKNTS